MAARAKIEARGLAKDFLLGHEKVAVLDRLDVAIDEGKFICLLGPSGCGKTTFLRCVAGLETPSAGVVLVDGRPVTAPGPERSMVFQDYALFSWCTVEENISFGLTLRKNRGIASSGGPPSVQGLVTMTKLEGFEHAYPHQISGGMRQRVAIARALAVRPEILLMDEPFAAVDAITRESLQRDLTDIWQAYGKTVLFVTHSVDEAAVLADEVLVFSRRPATVRHRVPLDIARPRRPADKGVIEAAIRLRQLIDQDIR